MLDIDQEYESDESLLEENVDKKAKDKLIYMNFLKKKANAEALKMSEQSILDRRTYLYVILLLLCSVENLRSFVSASGTYRGMTFIIPYTVTYFLVGMPLGMCQSFIGRYSHLNMIRIFEMAPLFYGLGYTYVLFLVFKVTKIVLRGARMITYLLYTFQSTLQYEICPKFPYEGVHNKCYSSAKEIPPELKCKRGLLYKAQYHYMNITMSLNASEIENQRISNVGLSNIAVFWILIFITSLMGFKKISKMAPILVFAAMTCFVGMTILMMFELNAGSNSGIRDFFLWNTATVGDKKLWLVVFSTVSRLTEVESGIHIIFGSMLIDKGYAHYDVFLINIVAYVAVLWFCFIVYCLTGMVAYNYKVDISCISISGWSSFMAVLPEFISFAPMSHHVLNLVFFSAFSLYLVIAMAIIVCAIVEVLMDTYVILRTCKAYMTAAICVMCIIGSVLEHRALSKGKLDIYKGLHYIQGSFNAYLFCIPVFWIYGIQRIFDDFHFTMGYELSQFWKTSWKCLAVCTPVLLIVHLYSQLTREIKELGEQAIYYLSGLVFLAPIVIVFVINIVKASIKCEFQYLTRVSCTFGTASKEVRKERRNFRPHITMRHREKTMKCKHKCLVNNKQWLNMVEKNERDKKIILLRSKTSEDNDN